MSAATTLFKELTTEWSKGNQTDLAKVAKLLQSLKLELAQLGLLFPTSIDNNVADLVTARSVLEIGAYHSLRANNLKSFESYISLLSTYYSDLSSLPASESQNPISALALLHLLSTNKIAEFHTMLEILSETTLQSPSATWVIALERSLMEGSYSLVHRLLTTPASLPILEFSFFTTALLAMVRSEIATCCEKSYLGLGVGEGRVLLFFGEESEVIKFGSSRGWKVTGGKISFPTSGNNVPGKMGSGIGESKELDKEKVVFATLGYARELESIV